MASSSGAWWPLKKTIGAWSRSATDGGGGVDDLPGEQALPVAGDDRDEVADVVGVVVPVVPRGPCRSLLTSTGARPLARNSSAKLVATTGFSRDAPPEARQPVLGRGQAPRRPGDTSRCGRRSGFPRAGRRAPGRRGSSASTAGPWGSSGRRRSWPPSSRCRAGGSG